MAPTAPAPRIPPARRRPPRVGVAVLGVFFFALAGLQAWMALGRAGAGEEGVSFAGEDLPWAEALSLARGEGPLIVDLRTASCSWCDEFDRDTLGAPEVGRALRGFACVRYGADAGPGAEVAARFGVRLFPTVLFVHADGTEVDRVTGAVPPDAFLAQWARVRAGRDTLRALRLAQEADPTAPLARVAYGRRLLERGDLARARTLLEPVATGARDAPGRASALLGLALADLSAGADDAALEGLAKVAREHAGAPEEGEARLARVRALARLARVEDLVAEAAFARAVLRDDRDLAAVEEAVARALAAEAQRALVRWGDRALAASDAASLLAAAEEALRTRSALGSAVRWCERAAELTGRGPAALATLADLHRAAGSPGLARAAAEEALPRAKDPALRARVESLLAALGGVPGPVPPASTPGESR